MKLADIILGNIGQTILFFLTVIGFVLAIIFYYKTKKKKIIQARVNSTNLFTDKNQIPNIKILYKDTPVETLTVSEICVWSAGNDVIRKNDISETNPIAISVSKDSELFEYRLVSVSDKDCDIFLNQDNKKIVVEFAYLEPKQGFVIQIIHSGKNSESLHFSGKIICGKKLLSKKDNDKLEINFGDEKIKISYIIIKYIFIFYGLSKFLVFVDPELENTEKIIVSIIGAIYLLIGFLIPTTKKIPAELKKTFEEG